MSESTPNPGPGLLRPGRGLGLRARSRGFYATHEQMCESRGAARCGRRRKESILRSSCSWSWSSSSSSGQSPSTTASSPAGTVTGTRSAEIDVQLKRRYDLIPNLVETAKGYLKRRAREPTAVAARNAASAAARTAAARPGGAMAGLSPPRGRRHPDTLGRGLPQSEGQPDHGAAPWRSSASTSDRLRASGLQQHGGDTTTPGRPSRAAGRRLPRPVRCRPRWSAGGGRVSF